MGDDARLEDAIERLRARGERITTARRAVLAALLDHPEHVSADELARSIGDDHPDIHISTIYRTLDAFEHLGVVTHVHLGHGRAMYHLAADIHHHAVCEVCGQVVQLPADVLADVTARLRQEFGFRVAAHHFALMGRCADCADPP